MPPGGPFSDERPSAARLPSIRIRKALLGGFVAVSTADWDTGTSGLVRLESVSHRGERPTPRLTLKVSHQQDQARAEPMESENLCTAWKRWEKERAESSTCHQMCAELRRLRDIYTPHPRLDGGRWWVQLGSTMDVPSFEMHS